MVTGGNRMHAKSAVGALTALEIDVMIMAGRDDAFATASTLRRLCWPPPVTQDGGLALFVLKGRDRGDQQHEDQTPLIAHM